MPAPSNPAACEFYVYQFEITGVPFYVGVGRSKRASDRLRHVRKMMEREKAGKSVHWQLSSESIAVRLTTEQPLTFTVRTYTPTMRGSVHCSVCRKAVDEDGADRPGAFICAACREHTKSIIQAASVSAVDGNSEIAALRGYKILQKLGGGGMGAVFLAQMLKDGQPAAIKVILPKVAASERAVSLFRREIRNTMALDHRNVVRCLDHGFANGAFFLVLDYCDAGSVGNLMEQRGGTLTVDEAVEITLQALDGLEYAHHAPIPFVVKADGEIATGAGLVHRDLKPANLFLHGSGSGRTVKVGDFGLAKSFEEVGLTAGTRTGDAAGTPKFMCRGQVVGYKTAGPEVDVWSMAASLYAMLTGQVPRDFPKSQNPWLAVLEPVQKAHCYVVSASVVGA